MSRSLILSVCLALCVVPGATPAVAQQETPRNDLREGVDLLGEGARLMLRGLMAEMEPALRDMGEALNEMRPVLQDLARMIGDIRNYNPPEMLPNGDIILRRKVPLPDPVPQAPEPGEEIDL